MEIEVILAALRYTGPVARVLLGLLSQSKDETPSNVDVQQKLIEFHAWLIASSIAIRQLIAFSASIDHAVKPNLESIIRTFKSEPDKLAEAVRTVYCEYDLEMAQKVVRETRENLEGFLPIRGVSQHDGRVEGHDSSD